MKDLDGTAKGEVAVGLFLTGPDNAAAFKDNEPIEQKRSVQMHVHSAINLPAIEGVPHAFVTGKSAREAVARTPARAATHVAKDTRHPLWNDALVVPLVGHDAEDGELYVAVVNNANRKLLGRCSIPLQSMAPGKQYVQE